MAINKKQKIKELRKAQEVVKGMEWTNGHLPPRWFRLEEEIKELLEE